MCERIHILWNGLVILFEKLQALLANQFQLFPLGRALFALDPPDGCRIKVVIGENDMAEAVRTAVINKRAGGMGLISGRKAFQRPLKEGIAILNAIQDVYLSRQVTIA